MIVIDHILGNLQKEPTALRVIPVPYEWFECQRRRIKKTAADGLELGIAIPNGVKEHDILYTTDTACYAVVLNSTHLIAIDIHSVEEAARVGFELGNRHLSLKITPLHIYVPYDEPTFVYLNRLGFTANEVTGQFSDFIQCKAHGVSEQEHHHKGEHTHTDAHGHSYTHCHE